MLQSTAVAQTGWVISKVSYNGQLFKVPYSVTHSKVTKMYVGPTFDSLIIAMASDANHKGTAQVTVPRNLIDVKRTDGTDDIFTVLLDGKEISKVEEINSSPCFRTLSIPFDAGTKTIDIIAAMIPEITTPRRSDVAPIYITTDKSNYEPREEIKVSGCTSLALDDKYVVLEYIFPKGGHINTGGLETPNIDGSFSDSLCFGFGCRSVTRGNLTHGYNIAINGTYTVKATYAGQSATSSFFVVPEFPFAIIIVSVAIGVMLSIVSLIKRRRGFEFMRDFE